jgi:bacillithiol biosynthesis cysteine-adding enzyme BshC
MPLDRVSYKTSGYFSKIIIDYLNQEPSIKPFYHRYFDIENFSDQIDEKKRNYRSHRKILADTLLSQYQNTAVSLLTKNNIIALENENTFTVTTGHQLNIFGGPLYFIYKIVTTLNLSKKLKNKYPQFDFVPVFWMASEDHDFEEISSFNFNGKQFKWHQEGSGPVGRRSTEGLQAVLNELSNELDSSTVAMQIRALFSKAYLQNKTLAAATRYFVNELFGDEGLVILDGDDVNLKKCFIPFMVDEIENQTSHLKIQETLSKWHYPAQVNPRELNLFYIKDGLRERIIKEDSLFRINQTGLAFSKSELLAHLHEHPENFSPNVVLRPLYQEVLLPNLCYIGGGGELAYWLELKTYFNSQNISFPILMLRNSLVLVLRKQLEKANKLGLSWSHLFMFKDALLAHKTRELSKLQLDLSTHKAAIAEQFNRIDNIAKETDKSFGNAVQAELAKQIKGLEKLERRLLKAEKRVHSEELDRIGLLKDNLFPGGVLQERVANFSEWYLREPQLIERIKKETDPWDDFFGIVTI